MSPKIRVNLGGSSLDRAYFLYNHALDLNWMSQMTLNYKFRGTGAIVQGGLNENLRRIAQRIDEKIGKLKAEPDKTFRVTDIIKQTVFVDEPAAVQEAYELIKKTSTFQIVKIKQNLEKYLHNVTLNVICQRAVIGEIEIRYGARHATYAASQFLNELSRAESPSTFRQQLLLNINSLAREDRLFSPYWNLQRFEERFQELSV